MPLLVVVDLESMGSDQVLPKPCETLTAFVAERAEFIDVKDSVVTLSAWIAFDGIEICGQRSCEA